MDIPPTQINIAVIGAGGAIGPRHAASVLQYPQTHLIAIVDPAPHVAKLAADLDTNYYSSVAQLLSSPHKPDAAIVCTPNHTHVVVAKELTDAGVHILIEKPMCTDIASGQDLIKQVALQGTKLLVGHHRRFNPYIQATKQALDSGLLGDIVAVNGLWTTFKPDDYFIPPSEWRRGGSAGVILINFIHDIDLMHYLFGPIVRVHAEKTVSQRGFEAVEGAAVVLKFQSGLVGSFLVSDNAPSPHNFEAGTGENPSIPYVGMDVYRIFGRDAMLSVPDMRRWSYDDAPAKHWTKLLKMEVHPVCPAVPFDRQLAHFVEVIKGKEEPICTGQVGLDALVVCDAIMAALETGQSCNIQVSKL
ncbi:hypothetical protein MMC08_006663 [Hypocenomyce scalaris]|nr:hypothetical protein [Hypocenomyce scalaris]